MTCEVVPNSEGGASFMCSRSSRPRPKRLALADYKPAGEGITVYTDGAITSNPGGHATWAFWATNAEGEILTEQWGTVGVGAGMTVNVAEYSAVRRALRWAYQAGYRKVLLRSDSQVVVNQCTGKWKCHGDGASGSALAWYLDRVRKACELMAVSFEWVPREANTKADELSKRPFASAVGEVR
jgi:ribonuclease HI